MDEDFNEFYDGEVNDEDIYDEDKVDLDENDSLNPEEEGFMQGYNRAKVAKKRKKKSVAA